MRSIIGQRNAGFDIIEATQTAENTGYAIGRSASEYVVWWFCTGTGVDFYHGHYFPIDPDSPMKSATMAKADYHQRLAESFERLSRYGY